MTKEELNILILAQAKKKCNKCGEVKTVSDFYVKKCKENKYYRFNSPCKKCSDNKNRKEYLKNYLRIRNFKITTIEYESILKSQNYKCAICGVHKNDYHKDFSIDHCHKSGKVRGLLCNNCNVGIGLLKDDITILKSSINYLLSKKQDNGKTESEQLPKQKKIRDRPSKI